MTTSSTSSTSTATTTMSTPAAESCPALGPYVALAELSVRVALQTAGHRLLRTQDRSVRHRRNGLRDLDPSSWHTVISVADAGVDVDQLLKGALEHFDSVVPNIDLQVASCLRAAMDAYLRSLLAAGVAHQRDALGRMIQASGCLLDQNAA